MRPVNFEDEINTIGIRIQVSVTFDEFASLAILPKAAVQRLGYRQDCLRFCTELDSASNTQRALFLRNTFKYPPLVARDHILGCDKCLCYDTVYSSSTAYLRADFKVLPLLPSHNVFVDLCLLLYHAYELGASRWGVRC